MTAKGTTLGEADRALVEAASEAIRRRYRYDWQEVGAALRTRSGKIFTGVSLDAYLGRMAVCAEAVALGQARGQDVHLIRLVANVILSKVYRRAVEGVCLDDVAADIEERDEELVALLRDGSRLSAWWSLPGV